MIRFLVLSAFLTGVVFGGLPSYFPRCRIDDPAISECIVKASEDLRPYVKKGIPELNFPSFSPYYVEKVKTEHLSETLNFKVTFSDMFIYGLDDYNFTEFRYIPKELTYAGIGLFQNVSVTSKFEVEGKLLAFSLRGAGELMTVLDPSTGFLNVTGILETRNGEEYYKPVNAHVDIIVPQLRVNFTGLLEDNKQLKEVVLKLLNDNSQALLQEVRPTLNHVAEKIAMQLLTSISDSVPYKELFILSPNK